MTAEQLASLRRLYPVLDELDAAQAQRLAAHTQVVQLPGGAPVFDEHQACKGFPFLLEGAIRVGKSAPSGRELPLYRVLPGESCILSTSCLLGRTDYNARGSAEGSTVLAVLDAACFDELLGLPALRHFVFEQFAARIADLMQLIDAVAFRRLDQRLAALLLGKGPVLHVTHQQLAQELGSAREIVTRLLRHLAEEGLVRLGREQIEILDPARLRALAG